MMGVVYVYKLDSCCMKLYGCGDKGAVRTVKYP